MTRFGIIMAAEATLARAKAHGMENSWENGDGSTDYTHLCSMLEQMRDPEFSIGKLNRWLGWMQASVVAATARSMVPIALDEMKEINLRNRDA